VLRRVVGSRSFPIVKGARREIVLLTTEIPNTRSPLTRKELVDHPVEHEEIGHRGAFFLEQDGKRVAEMTYSRANDSLVIIDHTEVASHLGGQGVGRRLLDAAVDWARQTGTKIRTTCPYAGAQFAKDPSIRDVLA
jgi:predicted GNAT family acetyltransferase